ncbi:Solute carrier family 35 member F2 [Linum grandiflorum]
MNLQSGGSSLRWRIVYLVVVGQVVSLLLALTTFSASLIASLGVDVPITQGALTYLAGALVYGGILIHRRHKLLVSWYWYLLLSFLDVHAIFLFNKAYQFTSITSVTMLDCVTLLWVIILTRVFIGTRYSTSQFAGAAVCVAGLALVILSDVGVGGDDEGGSRPILGDILVITGTVFDALSNVGEEFCAKKKDRTELMAMIGVFGFLISVVEMYPSAIRIHITVIQHFSASAVCIFWKT